MTALRMLWLVEEKKVMEKKPNPQLKEFYKKHFSYKNINQTKRDFLQRFEE